MERERERVCVWVCEYPAVSMLRSRWRSIASMRAAECSLAPSLTSHTNARSARVSR